MVMRPLLLYYQSKYAQDAVTEVRRLVASELHLDDNDAAQQRKRQWGTALVGSSRGGN